MGMPMMDHLTDACEHERDLWCLHCEEGCEWCGSLEGICEENGWCLCEECSFKKSIDMAERMADGDDR